jgi:hypothetical protein
MTIGSVDGAIVGYCQDHPQIYLNTGNSDDDQLSDQLKIQLWGKEIFTILA